MRMMIIKGQNIMRHYLREEKRRMQKISAED